MAERAVLAGLTVASLAALAIAFWVQYGLGYPPCSLCEQARWPHWAILATGPTALFFARPRLGLMLVTGALFVAFVISLRHVGVEAGWLPVPDACAVSPLAAPEGGLRSALLAQTQPSCDQPGPRFAGLSMATWHALIAVTLAGLAAFTWSRAAVRR